MKKNTPARIALRKRCKQRNKARNTEYMRLWLQTHPCVSCGEADPDILEFDHIEPKLDGVSKLRKYSTLAALKREIAKCEVRCCNCHRKRHMLLLQSSRTKNGETKCQ